MLTLVPEIFREDRKVYGKYHGYPFYGKVLKATTNYRTKEALVYVDVSSMSPPMKIGMVRKVIHLTVRMDTQLNPKVNHEIYVRV